MATYFQNLVGTFFEFKVYVMLPVLMLAISLMIRVPFQQALRSSIALAAGFAGVFVAFHFFVSNINPAVQRISEYQNLHFSVLDVGWPPLAAITWASPIAALAIPVVLLTNVVMLAVGWTRTIYIDIWNYWHFSLVGALVVASSESLALGLLATLVVAIFCFKVSEWTAADVETEMGLKGVTGSPLSGNTLVPYAVCINWLFDRIPYIKNINYNPQTKENKQDSSIYDLLGEPIVIGFLMGITLAVSAGYAAKEILELGVHIAASMFLLPKSADLIGEAMTPITLALRTQVSRFFPQRENLVVAIDTGFLMNHKSVTSTGLILMSLALIIALVMPGNSILPLGDLSNLISVMSISVLIFRGNVFRAVLAGIPVIVSFLLISSNMAPLFTRLAKQTPSFDSEGLGMISAFTGGGNQLRFLVYSIFQLEIWAYLVSAVFVVAIIFTKLRSDRISSEIDDNSTQSTRKIQSPH